MISFAQNFEDVMLNRAFADIEDGYYVDVGAWDPVVDSVTKHFYDKGWHGTNIEPHPAYFLELCVQRTRDVNLDCVISNSADEVEFFISEHAGVSTLDTALRDGFAHLFPFTSKRMIPRTLSEVLAEAGASEIHFLKVDVEGHELQVLQSLDWNRWRPRVALVEAVHPFTQNSTADNWEPFLLSQEYQFIYFDGLNRFYVAAEHRDLASAFQTPPNVFDNFTLYQQQRLSEELQAVAEREGLQVQANAALTRRLCGLAGCDCPGESLDSAVQVVENHIHQMREELSCARRRIELADRERITAIAWAAEAEERLSIAAIKQRVVAD